MDRAGERAPTRKQIWLARAIALGADFLQIVAFPLFLPGAASPWSDALDLAVAGAMTALVGWHWAFLPSFVAEIVPGLDLVPTWTAAAFFVTRGAGGTAVPRPKPAPSIDAEVVRRSPAQPEGSGAPGDPTR